MTIAKKIINDGTKAADEMLAGILAAHPKHLRAAGGSPRSIVAKDIHDRAKWAS